MKAAACSIILFFVILTTVYSQKGLPAFGKVDKADLEMTDCDFDKGASAVVLIDYGNTYYDRGTVGYSTFKTVLEKRIRIKILKEKGLAQADISIPYYTRNNEEKIFKLNAKTYNLDESGKVVVTDVKKSSIYSKQVDASRSVIIISFPEVRVGSIIEYTYSLERETIYLKDWYFQGRIPVRYSEYRLKVPQFLRFIIQPNIVDPIEDKQEVTTEIISMDEGALETKVLNSQYIMRNLVGIKDEPYMGSPRDYMQRIEFQLSQIDYGDRVIDKRVKWSDVIKSLKKDESFGKQLENAVSAAAAVVDEAKQMADTENRMRFVFDKIRSSITWNDDEGIYADKGISKTWDSKIGNTGDINLLLIRLLMDVGLDVKPILFSTRDNGLAVPTYPDEFQFNSLMAFVTVDNKEFVLDATDKFINYKMTPEKVVNTNGFIVEGETGRWKEILSGKYKYKVMAATQGDIDENGVMKGNCLVNCYDYARVQRCEAWVKNQPKFKEDYFARPYPSARIEELNINNTETDSLPLEQKIKFISVLNSSGEYKYFTINLFSDLDENMFIAQNRNSDVDFGIHQEYTIFGNYTIPANYVFEGLPENISMTTSDRGIIFTRTITADGNLLNVRITVEFKRTFYPVSSYADFREFHKKLFDKLNEQVVIKKKADP